MILADYSQLKLRGKICRILEAKLYLDDYQNNPIVNTSYSTQPPDVSVVSGMSGAINDTTFEQSANGYMPLKFENSSQREGHWHWRTIDLIVATYRSPKIGRWATKPSSSWLLDEKDSGRNARDSTSGPVDLQTKLGEQLQVESPPPPVYWRRESHSWRLEGPISRRTVRDLFEIGACMWNNRCVLQLARNHMYYDVTVITCYYRSIHFSIIIQLVNEKEPYITWHPRSSSHSPARKLPKLVSLQYSTPTP